MAAKVVSMNYVLKDKEGSILDTSQGQPLDYLEGHQNIIPGLEKALTGLEKGDKKVVEVSPEEGYGQYNPDMCFTMEKSQFGATIPEPGVSVQLNTADGQAFLATIVNVEGDQVHLDANHPLAGKALIFDVEITDIRDASPEEITHGHPHGPGGHHH